MAALTGKAPEENVTVIDFSEVSLLCYVNHYWENGFSIDLRLIVAKEIKRAKYVEECTHIANIYMGDPELDQMGQACATRIPEPVRAVAEALILRTGVSFVDKVAPLETVRKKKRRG